LFFIIDFLDFLLVMVAVVAWLLSGASALEAAEGDGAPGGGNAGIVPGTSSSAEGTVAAAALAASPLALVFKNSVKVLDTSGAVRERWL